MGEKEPVMFAPMLFAISIVLLSQFGLYYWRVLLAAVAGQPVSDNVLAAASIENGRVTGRDFETLAGLHDLTLDLTPRQSGLGSVRLYYRIVDSIASMIGQSMPSVAAWCDEELTTCARYAAVRIENRLQSNLELAASMRSC
jgi:hypothetical protein